MLKKTAIGGLHSLPTEAFLRVIQRVREVQEYDCTLAENLCSTWDGESLEVTGCLSGTGTPIAPRAAPASLLAVMLMPDARCFGALQAAGTNK